MVVVGVNIMEEKTKIVSFNQLEEGMIVAKNVEQNGRVLLKKDFSITEQMIKKIQKLYFIESIEVYDRNIEKKQVSMKSKKEEEYNKVEEEFKEISLKLQITFRQIANENGIAMNEIREFSQIIQNELKTKQYSYKKYSIYGSGADVYI